MDFFEWGDGQSQDENLERVRGKIGRAVLVFCANNEWFHAQELRDYCALEAGIAPASPDRVLRDLRQKKLLNYEVVDRRMSYYHILPLPPEGVEVDGF